MILLSRIVTRCHTPRKLLAADLRTSLVRSRIPNHIAKLRSGVEPTQLRPKNLIVPFVFTAGVCSASFTFATIFGYERYEQFRKSLKLKMQAIHPAYRKNDKDDSILELISDYLRNMNKLFIGLLSINILVYLGWKLKRLQPWMLRNFTTGSEPNRIRLLPMVLANFSHKSGIHLAVNMFVLNSFIDISSSFYSMEYTGALYLSAGTMSSFASYLYKIFFGGFVPSLGASGSIMGILAATCIENPDMKMLFLLFPFISFSSMNILQGVIIFDLIGCILRWSIFDHAAHLGGTFFGVLYSTKFNHFIRTKQKEIVDVYLTLKKTYIK